MLWASGWGELVMRGQNKRMGFGFRFLKPESSYSRAVEGLQIGSEYD